MFKTLLTAAACTLALTAAAKADEMKACDDATMKMIMTETEASTDAAAKEMAMKELEMAKMAMTENKTEECSMHLGMAAEAVMK